MRDNVTSVSDPVEICELFASHFEANYIVSDLTTPPPAVTAAAPQQAGDSFSSLRISIADIFEGLSELNCKKGAGPDGIPNNFLSNCKYSLTLPLYFLFNKSLELGIFPSVWKSSRVFPVHKKGDKDNVLNYRPISILSSIPKLFEKLVVNQLRTHIWPAICTEQHGFVGGRSTLSNLALFKTTVADVIDRGSQLDVIYTDFSKAFDRVDHRVILHKLKFFGIDGALLSWVGSYLSNRDQYVQIENCKSESIITPSGVPQGSHLGPLLFIVFINDLPSNVEMSSILMYADDAKIFKEILCLDDAIALQNDLFLLEQWCNDNLLFLNNEKCVKISFTKKKKNKINFEYKLGQDALRVVDVVDDLGVTFDKDLSFNAHVRRVCSKASRTWGMLRRNCKQMKDVKSFTLLYKSLVLPNLEYNSVIWCPSTDTATSALESVQHRFLRYIAYLLGQRMSVFDHDYSDIMFTLDLPSLELRRAFADCTFVFKLLNNYIDAPDLLSLVQLRAPTVGTRSNVLFHIKWRRTELGKADIFPRVAKIANKVSCFVDFFDVSVNVFKSQLEKNLVQSML